MRRRVVMLLALTLSAGIGGAVSARQPPVVEMQVVEAYRGFPVSFSLAARGPDEDQLSFSILGLPSHGRVTGTPPDLVYTPDPAFEGVDQITYSVEDAFGAFDIGVVRINVRASSVAIRWIVPDQPDQRPMASDEQEDKSLIAEVAPALRGALAERSVETWNVVRSSMGVYAQGTSVPVVLAAQGGITLEWVAITQLGNGTTQLSSVPYETKSSGEQQIVLLNTADLAPGVYLVTLSLGATAYSLPFELQPLGQEGDS
ncbi:MAG: Ig-like domain-containing protein [Candidatus Bipolaricaulota bacterium]